MTSTPEFSFRVETDVTLTNVNPRKEMHGEQHRQAVDLSMACDVPNTKLNEIQPGLLEALFHNAAADAGQVDLDGVDTAKPNLRFPKLNESTFGLMRKKDVFAGYTTFIDFGLGDDRSNMEFDLCKVKNLKGFFKEGGTVHLTWLVQYCGDRLDHDTCGKLVMLEQDQIRIRLVPPAIQQIEQEKEEPKGNPMPFDADPPSGETAESLFAGTADAGSSGFSDPLPDADEGKMPLALKIARATRKSGTKA